MDVISAVTPPQGFENLDSFRAERAERAYKSFEGMFLQELLKEMRKAQPESELFPKSDAMKKYEEMLDGVLAQSMADSGQLGIAKELQAEARKREAAEMLAVDRTMQKQALETLKGAPNSADNLSGLGLGE